MNYLWPIEYERACTRMNISYITNQTGAADFHDKAIMLHSLAHIPDLITERK